MSDSGQRFIKRNRPPRVHITYQDPYDSEKLVELPFVMGVLADLSGNAPGAEKPEVGQRTFRDIDMDNFDTYMSTVKPGVSLRVDNKLSDKPDEKMQLTLHFNKMDDFKPAQLAQQIPPLAKLLEARQQLKNLQQYMDGKADAEAKLRQLLSDPALMAALRDQVAKQSDSKE